MAINVEPALSPHLVVDDAASAIDFYVKAFDAVELGRVPGPDGKLIHAALRINGGSCSKSNRVFGAIALTGQAVTQAPQSTQATGSI